MSEPFVPAVQTVYWVDTSILPAGDAERQRAVVVVAAPKTTRGTVTVVARSGTDAFGVAHHAEPALGLSAPGRFSRRVPVQGELWTPSVVARSGLLDDSTFAAVVARFGW
ncbi:MAG: hypothetical protein ACRD2W_17625 [Acidimicrobiales bacterium]